MLRNIKVIKNTDGIFYKMFDINKNDNLSSLSSSTNCKKKIFEIGGIYRINSFPVIAERGFHFCKTLTELKQMFPNLTYHGSAIAIIEVLGDLIQYKTTYCSNKIKIVRIIDKSEIYDILDTELNVLNN